MIRFDKYDRWHDYHWREYERDSIYRAHALKVKDWVRERDVLDVGCGDGLITHLIGGEGFDNHAYAVELAKKHGVNAWVDDLYDMSEVREYDAVFLGDVIEHLDYPEKCIKEISTKTKKLYIATPPKKTPFRPYHVREFEQDELRDFMAELGWKQISSEKANDRIYALFVLE